MSSAAVARYRLLVMGSSQVNYSDTTPAETTPNLMKRYLEESTPSVAWSLETVLLYPTRSMAARAREAIERVRPDLVFFAAGTNTFAEESVAFKLRRTARPLHAPAVRLIEFAKSAAGGGTQGSSSIRGWLFRGPRALARRMIGTAPLIDPDEAFAVTRELLADFAATGGLRVVCRLAMGHYQQPEQGPLVRERTRLYNTLLVEECQRLGYPYLDCARDFEARGWPYTTGPDGLHETLATRQYGGRLWAELVLRALELEAEAGSGG